MKWREEREASKEPLITLNGGNSMADTIYGIAFGLIIAGAIIKWSNSPRVKNGTVFLLAGLILFLVTSAIDYQNILKDFKAGFEGTTGGHKSSDSTR